MISLLFFELLKMKITYCYDSLFHQRNLCSQLYYCNDKTWEHRFHLWHIEIGKEYINILKYILINTKTMFDFVL
jgi:hypothetical protein